MRKYLAVLTFAAAFLVLVGGADAKHKIRFHHHGHGYGHGHYHRGYSSWRIHLGFAPYYAGTTRTFAYSARLPGYSYYSYGYDPYCGGLSSYGATIPFSGYYLPPVYEPAELRYGPQALNRFLGRAPLEGLQIAPAPPLGAVADPLVVDKGPVVGALKPSVRESNLLARTRAERWMNLGDDLFQEQRYQEALQRYKSAADAAPDLAEAYFRQGHALVATNRFELAVAAFKRALALQPDLERDDFQLDDLYADNGIAKRAHRENLAQSALAHPDDADRLFLLGMFLRYDGQPERAMRFFQGAAQLAGNDDAHLRGFLSPRKPTATAEANTANGFDT